jgi:hypothetical protein
MPTASSARGLLTAPLLWQQQAGQIDEVTVMTSYEAWIGYWAYIWLNSGSKLHSTGVRGANLSWRSEAERCGCLVCPVLRASLSSGQHDLLPISIETCPHSYIRYSTSYSHNTVAH